MGVPMLPTCCPWIAGGVTYNQMGVPMLPTCCPCCLGHSKKPTVVQTRSLLCYWAVREVGMTTTDVAGKIGISQSAVWACCAGRAFCNREGVAIAVKGRNAELHGRPLFAWRLQVRTLNRLWVGIVDIVGVSWLRLRSKNVAITRCD